MPGITTLLVAVALLVLGFTLTQATTAGTSTPAASASVRYDNVKLAASWVDCAEAAAAIYGSLQSKGLKVAVSRAAIAKNLASLIYLVPGVSCGKWLGDQNAKQICWWSQRNVWLPPAAYARGFVWVVTGGQTNQCVP